ncbi:MAG: ribosome rescue protein RqcH [Halobacteriales archaeon]
MDAKRELSSVDLVALVGELGAYEGAKVDKVYLYGDDLLRFKMRDFDRGRIELLVEVGDIKRAHLADPETVPNAPERPPDFARKLRDRIAGAEFQGVEQYEFDRILQFHFERSDVRTTVVAELFGQGNVAVLDADRMVIDSLETVRLQSRTVAPGAQYDFPESRINPLTVDYEGFVAALEDSDTDVVRTLATQLNFGGLYGEEICTRAGVEKTLAIEQADESTYEALYRAVDALAETLASGDLNPQLYRQEEQPIDVTPVPLEERADLGAESFETFNTALATYFEELEQAQADTDADRPNFEAEIAKHERIIEQQENAIEEFERQAAAQRERAEALYAQYDRIDEILTTIQTAREQDIPWSDIVDRFEEGKDRGIPAAEAVVDIDPEAGKVTIDLGEHTVGLDPTMGVEKNADRLYQEAKRIEEKKAGAEEAIAETREELEAIRERQANWSADDDGEATADDSEGSTAEPSETDWLSASSIPIKQSEQWYERFRWFRTSDGFLVIGGRNADQNEEIVEKYLDREDRFFHTQAHGGPATVLKATEPSEAARDVTIPDRSLEETAQFAVSYSSVWKDGRFSGDVYMVDHDQVSKTPESGEFLEKGGFAIRGDRTYFRDTEVGVAVGIMCEPETRVIGGPPSAIDDRTTTSITVEPGRYAQNDIAKRLYREFRERFTDETFVRKVASADRIQEFLPPGGSRIAEE